jgi:hypothetical protein
VVEDLGSSNGTFIKGAKIQGAHALGLGDEIGFGKFSIVFGKALGEGEHAPPGAAAAPSRAPAPAAATQGTMHINPHEVRELLKDADRKKRAHLQWESGGEKGTHYLSEAPAILIGTDELCDVRVPKGPKHHVLIVRSASGTDVRYLATFGSMTVRGEKTERAKLKNGDMVEAGGLTITFVDDVS